MRTPPPSPPRPDPRWRQLGHLPGPLALTSATSQTPPQFTRPHLANKSDLATPLSAPAPATSRTLPCISSDVSPNPLQFVRLVVKAGSQKVRLVVKARSQKVRLVAKRRHRRRQTQGRDEPARNGKAKRLSQAANRQDGTQPTARHTQTTARDARTDAPAIKGAEPGVSSNTSAEPRPAPKRAEPGASYSTSAEPCPAHKGAEPGVSSSTSAEPRPGPKRAEPGGG